MLLGFVGETDRSKHTSARIALLLESTPEVSRVFRKGRKMKNAEYFHKENSFVDYVEILTNIRFSVWVEAGESESTPSLRDRLIHAYEHPASVDRFGVHCLGESDNMVDDFRHVTGNTSGQLLTPNLRGRLQLPLQVDYQSIGTRWGRFDLFPWQGECPPDNAFFVV
jgi:CRISPR-associated protein Cas5t